MRIRTLLTKNPVCLEWFSNGKDDTRELALTFGDSEYTLAFVEGRMDGAWQITDNSELWNWNDSNNVYCNAEDAMQVAEDAALSYFGLEMDCAGKDALSAHINKEK